MKVLWQFLLFSSLLKAVLSQEQEESSSVSSTIETTSQATTIDTAAEALAKAGQHRKNLIEFLVQNPNSKSCRASTHMQKFIETHNLQTLPSLNLLDFQRFLKAVDPSVDPKHASDIHSHYIRYIEFVNNLKSRNRLVGFIRKYPSAEIIEISTYMEEFLTGHKMLETPADINKEAFVDLMRNRDNFISDQQIDTLYSRIPAYLTFYGRVKAREALLKLLERDRTAEMSRLRPEMDTFISKFGLDDLTIKTEALVKLHITANDHFIYPEDLKLIVPIYMKYQSFRERKAERIRTFGEDFINLDRLEASDNPTLFASLDSFMKIYNLKEEDVSELEKFSKLIRDQDDEIIPGTYKNIHPLAIRYQLFSKRKKIRTDLQEFLRKTPAATIPEIQPFMTPFIEVFELKEISGAVDFFAKINDYDTEAGLTANNDILLFEKFSDFNKFYQKKQTFTKLAEDLKKTQSSTESRDSIEKFLAHFTDLDDDVYYIYAFTKKIKQFDNSISDDDIKLVYHKIKEYKIDQVKRSIRDSIQQELDKTEETRNRDNLKLYIDTLAAVYDLKEEDLSTQETFVNKIKSVDILATFGDAKIFYEAVKTRMDSKEFKDKIDTKIRKLVPGDFDDKGEIVPPTGGFKLFWFKFFRAFGGVPHKVPGVKSYSELFVFKRWFNAVYKWLTGINYYILIDAPVKSDAQNIDSDSTNKDQPTEPTDESSVSDSTAGYDSSTETDGSDEQEIVDTPSPASESQTQALGEATATQAVLDTTSTTISQVQQSGGSSNSGNANVNINSGDNR